MPTARCVLAVSMTLFTGDVHIDARQAPVGARKWIQFCRSAPGRSNRGQTIGFREPMAEIDARLLRVIESWPALPECVRLGMEALCSSEATVAK
jgi:hypothetical protein